MDLNWSWSFWRTSEEWERAYKLLDEGRSEWNVADNRIHNLLTDMNRFGTERRVGSRSETSFLGRSNLKCPLPWSHRHV